MSNEDQNNDTPQRGQTAAFVHSDEAGIVSTPDDGTTITKSDLNTTLELPYEQIANLNRIAGNPPMDVNDKDYWEKLKKQADLIQSELNEVYEAIENKDLENLRQEAPDVDVTLHGLFYRAGIPYYDDMQSVIDALYTRFGANKEEALETMEHYRNIGVETHYLYDDLTGYYVVKSSHDQTGTDGKSYPGGKWLKNIHHKKPVFRPIEL